MAKKVYMVERVYDSLDEGGYVQVWMCRPPFLGWWWPFVVTDSRWSENGRIRWIYAWRYLGRR